MKKVFLTFGDGGANFIAARERIVSEARKTGCFDEILGYDMSNVSPKTKRSKLFEHKRRCGYWVWKPDIILSVLSQLRDGDVLVYCDAGCSLFCAPYQWKRLLGIMRTRDVLVRKIPCCTYRWTCKSLLELFSEEISKTSCNLCFQFEASIITIKKSDFTTAFVSKWLDIMLDHPERIVDVDEKGRVGQLPTFLENRHDQSVLTLLLYKYLSNVSTHDLIAAVWDFHWGPNLFSVPAVEASRQRNGTSYRFGLRACLIRVVQRLVYGVQSCLERWCGVQLCWSRLAR